MASTTNNTTNNNAAVEEWHKVASIYPSPGEIATALQDAGKEKVVKNKKGQVTQHRFPLMEKLATDVYKRIFTELKPEGLTKNVSRGKLPLYKEIVLKRRHVDVHETNPFFHQYRKDGKVYLIANDPKLCGLDLAVQSFQDYIKSETNKRNMSRTTNDGLRLSCIMLDAKFRGPVSSILSKKKTRTKSDVAGDPALHFFESILHECFLSESYIVPLPPQQHYEEFPEEEKGKWEPNSPAIFETERDAAWLKATWEEYIRPKYKKALDRWNKDTGGGDGTPSSFIDYCAGDRWLVWIFCVDLEANFLLANNAGGRMPRHMQVEAGFDEDMSSVSSSNNKRSVASLEDTVDEARRQRKRLNDTIGRLNDLLDQKEKSPPAANMVQVDQVDQYIEQVAKYSQLLQDPNVTHDMSPASKSAFLSTLNKKRKDVIKKMAAKDDSEEETE